MILPLISQLLCRHRPERCAITGETHFIAIAIVFLNFRRDKDRIVPYVGPNPFYLDPIATFEAECAFWRERIGPDVNHNLVPVSFINYQSCSRGNSFQRNYCYKFYYIPFYLITFFRIVDLIVLRFYFPAIEITIFCIFKTKLKNCCDGK